MKRNARWNSEILKKIYYKWYQNWIPAVQKAWLTPDEFSWHLILGTYIKICCENPDLVKLDKSVVYFTWRPKYVLLLLVTWKHCCQWHLVEQCKMNTWLHISMATFSVFITFVTLPILYVKSDFIPHREHLMHTGFLCSTIWIFVYYESPRPRYVYIVDSNMKSQHNLLEPKGIGPLRQLTMYKQYRIFPTSTTVLKRMHFLSFHDNSGYTKAPTCCVTYTCSIHIITERCYSRLLYSCYFLLPTVPYKNKIKHLSWGIHTIKQP